MEGLACGYVQSGISAELIGARSLLEGHRVRSGEVTVHGFLGVPGLARSRHPGSRVPNRPPASARGRGSPGIGSQKSLLGPAVSQRRSPLGQSTDTSTDTLPHTEYPGFQTLGERASAPSFLTDPHLSLLTPSRQQPVLDIFTGLTSTDHNRAAYERRAEPICKSLNRAGSSTYPPPFNSPRNRVCVPMTLRLCSFNH